MQRSIGPALFLLCGACGYPCGAGTHVKDGACVADEDTAASHDSEATDSDSATSDSADTGETGETGGGADTGDSGPGDTDTGDSDTGGGTDSGTDSGGTDTGSGDTGLPAIARWSGGYDLTDDAILIGGYAEGDYGETLAVGDLTGDGIDDLVVGNPYDPRGTYDGNVFVVPGPIDANTALGASGGRHLAGDTAHEWYGALLTVLDRGSDMPVLAVAGAFGSAESSVSGNGTVYLYDGPLDSSTGKGDADGTLKASSAKDGFGVGLTALGDQDGDGDEELVVSAPDASGRGSSSGSVFVFQGPVSSGTESDAAVRIDGTASGQEFGTAVHDLGDLDGDGVADLGIGEFNGGGTSGPYAVFLGGSLSTGSAEDADIQIQTTSKSLATLPYGAAGVGDVDGDGQADLLLGDQGFGTTSSSSSSPEAGAAWLLSGASLGGDLDVDAAAANFSGTTGYGSFGFAVGGPGDLDGDGFADVIITEEADSERFSTGGTARIWYGPVSGDQVDTDADATFYAEGGNAGKSLLCPGDLTGDGLPDLVVGAADLTGTGSTTGAAYIIPGGL